MSDKPSIQPQHDATNPKGQSHTLAGAATGWTPNGSLIPNNNMTISPTENGGRSVEKQ